MRPEDWEELDLGRAAVLRLRSNRGALDIYVVYFTAGNKTGQRERSSLRRKFAGAMRPAHGTLSIIMGDFNYVTSEDERVTKHTSRWSGLDDMFEENDFQEVLAKPFALSERQQEHFTCDTALARSRLDRIYSNQHLTDQLDRWHGCSALQWVRHLSAHRPVSFTRRTPTSHKECEKPLPLPVIKDPSWPVRVALRFQELRASDDRGQLPLRKLLLVKQAMREVTA